MMLVMAVLLNHFFLGIARHFCLVGHYHGTTIALESHAVAGLLSLCNQCLVAEQIYFRLTVQKYEVHIVIKVRRLIKDLGDLWIKLSVQLCELKPPVCNLKVRILFLVIIIIEKFGV